MRHQLPATCIQATHPPLGGGERASSGADSRCALSSVPSRQACTAADAGVVDLLECNWNAMFGGEKLREKRGYGRWEMGDGETKKDTSLMDTAPGSSSFLCDFRVFGFVPEAFSEVMAHFSDSGATLRINSAAVQHTSSGTLGKLRSIP